MHVSYMYQCVSTVYKDQRTVQETCRLRICSPSHHIVTFATLYQHRYINIYIIYATSTTDVGWSLFSNALGSGWQYRD